MKNAETLFPELGRIVHADFTGQVVLHCLEGQVVKYDVSETRRPGRGAALVDLAETSAPAERQPAAAGAGRLLRGRRR